MVIAIIIRGDNYTKVFKIEMNLIYKRIISDSLNSPNHVDLVNYYGNHVDMKVVLLQNNYHNQNKRRLNPYDIKHIMKTSYIRNTQYKLYNNSKGTLHLLRHNLNIVKEMLNYLTNMSSPITSNIRVTRTPLYTEMQHQGGSIDASYRRHMHLNVLRYFTRVIMYIWQYKLKAFECEVFQHQRAIRGKFRLKTRKTNYSYMFNLDPQMEAREISKESFVAFLKGQRYISDRTAYMNNKAETQILLNQSKVSYRVSTFGVKSLLIFK